jgi:hypothetical protein
MRRIAYSEEATIENDNHSRIGCLAYPLGYTAKEPAMSLTVSPGLLDQARNGSVDDDAFAACIQASLPYAWQLIGDLTVRLHASGADFADNQAPPPDEAARGQLLRMMASDAMRAAAERHFGVRLAFQNCHRAAVFRPTATDVLAEFTTARAQLLNQSPELVNC